jgi:Sulfite exporter TauE/SafE
MSGAVESTLLVADPSLLSDYSPPVSKVERKESKMPSIKAERDDRNPIGRIPTLLLPWSLLGLIAVLAAAFHWNLPTISTTDDSWLRSLQKQGQAVFADHKTLLPLDSTDYLGLFCAVLGLMVAAGGGIGGGGILVPIYILVMGFSPKHAIPLSNVTVFGGAVANAVLNANKRHPLTDRPLVDWDLILVMEPLTIAGALMGAFLNKILPSELLVVMLVLLLAFTAYTTLETAIKMYKVETRQMRAMESELTKIVHDDEEEEVEQQAESLLEHMELQEGESPGDGSMTEIPFKGESELAQILDEERVTPMANVHMVGVLFVVVLFINLMKGGGAFPSPLGIRCGSNSFWIANGLMFGWILVISFYARAYLVKRFETKRRVGYQYVEGDIQWDGRATIVYPALCAFAGFFAGM